SATVPKTWPDDALLQYMGTTKRPEADILATARRSEPGLTGDELRRRLSEASNAGLIQFHTRRGVGWEIRHEPKKVKGRMTFTFDGGPPTAFFLDAAHRAEPMSIDRFGIFNMQLPGRAVEFYLSNLTVNGRKVDLSK